MMVDEYFSANHKIQTDGKVPPLKSARNIALKALLSMIFAANYSGVAGLGLGRGNQGPLLAVGEGLR